MIYLWSEQTEKLLFMFTISFELAMHKVSSIYIFENGIKKNPQETNYIFQYSWSLQVGRCENPPQKWSHK